MMMSERPNRPRGISRFSARNGCKGERSSVRLVLSNAVWDQDIADTTDSLEIEGKFGVLFDFAAQARHLHIHGTFELDVQPRAQRGTAEGAARIGGEQLEHQRFGTGQLNALAGAGEFAAFRIEHAFAHAYFAMRRRTDTARAADEGSDAQGQLARLEGLGEVIVNATFEPSDAVRRVAKCG